MRANSATDPYIMVFGITSLNNDIWRQKQEGNWWELPPALSLFRAITLMGVRRGEGARQVNRALEKDRLITSFPLHPLVVVKANAICLVAFHRNKK